jgi:hypothetical protein
LGVDHRVRGIGPDAAGSHRVVGRGTGGPQVCHQGFVTGSGRARPRRASEPAGQRRPRPAAATCAAMQASGRAGR